MQNEIQPYEGGLPLHLTLLAACCDHPVTSATTTRIETLANRITDWAGFSKDAVRHQVQGFVHDRLGDKELVPEHIRQTWSKEARHRAFINLMQAKATGALHTLLSEGGIANIVLKGLPLAIQIYGSLNLKRSSDIDLLVSPQDAYAAVSLLAENGFVEISTKTALSAKQTACVQRHYKEITLRNADGLLIDLHWRLVEPAALLRGIDPFADSRTVALANVGEIPILGEADEFAYLCAHGALSNWCRLKWLVDVHGFISDRNDDELLDLYDHAKQLGVGECVLQAIGLRAQFWDRPVPEELIDKLDTIGSPVFLSYPLDRMLLPYRPVSSRDTMMRIARQTKVRSILLGSHLAAYREWKTHLKAVPDILAFPLPAGMDWIYPVLRPILWATRRLKG